MKLKYVLKVATTAILLGLSILGCPRVPQPPVQPDGPTDADAAVSDAGDDSWVQDAAGSVDATPVDAGRCPACKAACEALERLGCPEAKPADAGQGCQEVLEHAQTSGKFDLKPYCVAAAKSRADLAKCGTVRCQDPRWSPIGDGGR